MWRKEFPFVINSVAEEDIAVKVFAAMAHFETSILLKFKAVSRSWRDAIDTHTLLWSRMPLFTAVAEDRADICKLILRSVEDKNPGNKKGDSTSTPAP